MEFDDLGNWLKTNKFLAAATRFRWQLTVTHQVYQSTGKTVNLQQLLPDAAGENLAWTNASDLLILQTPNWLSKAGVLQRLELETQLLVQTLGKDYFLNPSSTLTSADQGVTIRWQLPEALLQQSYQEKFKALGINYLTYRSQIYLKILQRLNQYHWIFLYLTAATPQGTAKLQRSSYWQRHFAAKARSVQQVIPHRLADRSWKKLNFRPYLTKMLVGQQAVEIVAGIEYAGLEADPFYSTGLNPAVLNLLQLLTAYFWAAPGIDTEKLDHKLQQGIDLSQQTAAGNPFAVIPELKTALKLFNHLADYRRVANMNQDFQLYFERWRSSLTDGTQNLSGRVLRQVGNNQAKLQQVAQKNQTRLIANWQNEKLIDHNSAALLTAAFAQGKTFQLISPTEHLVKIADKLIGDGLLTDDTGNLGQRCWHDRQLASQLAAAAGWQVPAQWLIRNRTEFEEKYADFAQAAVALKGRYQTGSRVFRLPPTAAELWQQIKQVLQHDQGCLVEQAQPGTCYRVLIAGGEPLSVLERLPQQVVGNGRSTIEQLIKQKQVLFQQQRRIFPFAAIETATLAEQGQQLTTVLPRGVQLLLRFDSSYQNGEEYLELFSELDPSYLTALKRLAADLNLVNGVLDVIMPNIYLKYQPRNSNQLFFLTAHQTTDLRIFQQLKMGSPRPLAKLILTQLLKK
ncbi:hypothetical protein FC89_GL001993 [Liquorilactobacillus ghanensis DSM 18630]|uniref:Bifunctional glutamate--cysteine ligase glutathione synthetase n=1 Tax=Liquorilactobacillus ghanensis DSM 18630 TaxID=1423750 RepID=A0A0R1VPY8_9LACO|nr:hypothetical protein [Liquorilactobacillus ghanensis]KRM07886.1 hypothetical protein FC89_GL001993 [Liquorilactobacillus ghanensis DSM 18630]